MEPSLIYTHTHIQHTHIGGTHPYVRGREYTPISKHELLLGSPRVCSLPLT